MPLSLTLSQGTTLCNHRAGQFQKIYQISQFTVVKPYLLCSRTQICDDSVNEPHPQHDVSISPHHGKQQGDVCRRIVFSVHVTIVTAGGSSGLWVGDGYVITPNRYQLEVFIQVP